MACVVASEGGVGGSRSHRNHRTCRHATRLELATVRVGSGGGCRGAGVPLEGSDQVEGLRLARVAVATIVGRAVAERAAVVKGRLLKRRGGSVLDGIVSFVKGGGANFLDGLGMVKGGVNVVEGAAIVVEGAAVD